MKKRTAVAVLGGNMSEAARNIGCTPEAVRRWPTDQWDNITSKRICDLVLATLTRMNYREMNEDGHPSGLRQQFDADTLEDLFTLPPEDEINVLPREEFA